MKKFKDDNTVADPEVFYSLPEKAQLLYHLLRLHADDDGFIKDTYKVATENGFKMSDIRRLVIKGYLLNFEDGVTVIRHHRNDDIPKEVYRETEFKERKEMLARDDEGNYIFPDAPEYPLYHRYSRGIA